jgi:sigma-B regulation protein RsbU (phosphoserine phosphatase)
VAEKIVKNKTVKKGAPGKEGGGDGGDVIVKAALERKGLSIKFKLAFAISFLVTLSLGILAWLIVQKAQAALITETTNRGIIIGRNLATYGSSAVLQKNPLDAAKMVNDAMKNEAMVYAVLTDEDGRVLAAPRRGAIRYGDVIEPPQGAPLDVQSMGLDARVEKAWDPESGKDILAFSFPIVQKDVLLGNAYVALSQSAIQAVVRSVTQDAILVSVALLAVAIALALFLAAVIVRPVERLTVGAINIGSGDFDTKIKVRSTDELGVLATAFNHMTAGLKRAQEEMVEKKLMKQELNIAHEIQFGLLPKSIPDIDGYKIAAFYEPAKEVGGDYYDFIKLATNRLAFTVADVSGKGIPGSMGMTMARSVLRDQAFSNNLPGETLRRTNQVIQPDIRRGMFVTMFYCILDILKNKVYAANAGHNPAVLLKQNGDIEEVGPEGMAVGLVPAKQYYIEETEFGLNQGDTFILFTDGVTEAMNLDSEEYGEDRFYASIKANNQDDLDAMLKSIVDDVLGFAGEAPRHDDITLLLLRRVS